MISVKRDFGVNYLRHVNENSWYIHTYIHTYLLTYLRRHHQGAFVRGQCSTFILHTNILC